MVCYPRQTSVSLNVETFPFPDSNETRIKIHAHGYWGHKPFLMCKDKTTQESTQKNDNDYRLHYQ